MENKIDHEIDKKLEELDIIEAIENKDVPYVIEQIKALIVESNNKAWDARGKADIELLKNIEQLKETFPELNLKKVD